MSLAKLKEQLESRPGAKRLAHRLLFPRDDYRPRWWIRALVNPWFHQVRGIVRRSVRLDAVPSRALTVEPRAIIEDHALINNVLGDVYVGESSLVGVGNVVIGPVTIGRDVLLAQYVVLSALNHEYADPYRPIRLQGVSVRAITVEDGAWVGAHAIVLPGLRVGRNAVVAAGAVVTKDVPDYSVVVGNPARVVRQYDPASGAFERWRADTLADLVAGRV